MHRRPIDLELFMARRENESPVRDSAGWTAAQLQERLKAAQLAGTEDEAEGYARRLREHPARPLDLNWSLHDEPVAAAAAEKPEKPLACAFWEELLANVGRRFMVRGFRPDWIREELAPFQERYLGDGRSPSYVLEIEEHHPGVLVGVRPFVVPPGWTWGTSTCLCASCSRRRGSGSV